MAPAKCFYLNCQHTSKHKSMFRFPIKNAERLKTWMTNCGNPAIFQLSKGAIRNRYLCISHFEAKYIASVTKHRMRIFKTAVPVHYENTEHQDISATPLGTLVKKALSKSQKYQKVSTPDRSRQNICNICKRGITMLLFKCVQCCNFNLCSACERIGEHCNHFLLRVPEGKDSNEVQTVLEKIRLELFPELNNIEDTEDQDIDPLAINNQHNEVPVTLNEKSDKLNVKIEDNSEDEDSDEIEESCDDSDTNVMEQESQISHEDPQLDNGEEDIDNEITQKDIKNESEEKPLPDELPCILEDTKPDDLTDPIAVENKAYDMITHSTVGPQKRKLDTDPIHDSGNKRCNVPSNFTMQPNTKFKRDSFIRYKKIQNEVGARLRRPRNVYQEQDLHELKMLRKKALIRRECNLLAQEKEIHDIHIKNIELQIELLMKRIGN